MVPSLSEEQPVIGRLAQPKALWDCQWMANSHANDSNNCFQPERTSVVEIYQGFILQSPQKDTAVVTQSRRALVSTAVWATKGAASLTFGFFQIFSMWYMT